jgi:hypothetical protein
VERRSRCGKAIIVIANEAEQRLVNSTMLVTYGNEISSGQQEEFVRTEDISKKYY